MTDQEAREVAGRLSATQSAVLLAICNREGQRGLNAQQIAYDLGKRPSHKFRFAMDRSARSLTEKGLIFWIRSRDDQWGIRLFYQSESGLAVARILQENRDGE